MIWTFILGENIKELFLRVAALCFDKAVLRQIKNEYSKGGKVDVSKTGENGMQTIGMLLMFHCLQFSGWCYRVKFHTGRENPFNVSSSQNYSKNTFHALSKIAFVERYAAKISKSSAILMSDF